MAATSIPRRRWLQFGLRTMFVVVTVVALWLGWEVNFVRQRQAWRREHAALTERPIKTPNPSYVPKTTIPPWRIWMGDSYLSQIYFPPDWTEQDRAYATRLFPEANLFRITSSDPLNWERIDEDPFPMLWDNKP